MRTLRDWANQTAGGLPRQFWYLWATTLVNRIGSFVIIILALYLTQDQGFSEAYAGLVIGLWGAGGVAGTLLGGVLADRWGRRPTFMTALYGSAVMMLTVGFIRGELAVAISVFLLGMFVEGARPAMSALMVDIVPDHDRMRAFSLNYWVINLGFAFAALLAGVLAEVDFQLLFVLDATTTTIAATLIAIAIVEPARRVAPSAVPQQGGLRTVFRDRVFMGFVGANLLLALVFMQHTSGLPLSMSRDGLSNSTYGTVIAINGILIVAGQLFVPRLLRGMRRSVALAVACLVIGIGFGLTAFVDTPVLYAATVIVWTIGEMLHAPSNSASVAELSPAHMRGRYQGVFSLSWSGAAFLAPVLGGAVLQYAGSMALWLGCLGITLVVAAINLLSGPARERRVKILLTGQISEKTRKSDRAVGSSSLGASQAEPVTTPAG